MAIAVGFYIAICVAMALGQRSLIYKPRVYGSVAVDQMARTSDLERWTNSDGQNIGFKRPWPTPQAVGNVLIAHGNGDTAISCAHYADDLQNVAAMN
ncbi:MAG: hypothetical protein ACRED1_05625, partial [Limisphaerales bacterium]